MASFALNPRQDVKGGSGKPWAYEAEQLMPHVAGEAV